MRSTFDNKLQLLDSEMLVMGSSVEEAVVLANKVVEKREKGLSDTVVEGDDDVDALEREIEGLCINLLLTQQPVASDLRRVSAALKMVGDMERIGDQAADISETMMSMRGELDENLKQCLVEMGKQAASMVHDAVQSYVDRDRKRAIRVMEADQSMNELFEKARADIVSAISNSDDPGISNGPGISDELGIDLVDALMIAKYYERIGDHAKNLAEWVEYSLVGSYKGKPIE